MNCSMSVWHTWKFKCHFITDFNRKFGMVNDEIICITNACLGHRKYIRNYIAAVKLSFFIWKPLSFVLEKEHWIKAMNMVNPTNNKIYKLKNGTFSKDTSSTICWTCNLFEYVRTFALFSFFRTCLSLFAVFISWIITLSLYGGALHKMRSFFWLSGKKMLQSEIKRKIDCTLSQNYHTTHIHTHN